MGWLTPEDRARIENHYSYIEDPFQRENSVQLQAAYEVLEDRLGTAWMARHARQQSVRAMHIVEGPGPRQRWEEAPNPIAALHRTATTREALLLNVLAQFFLELESSNSKDEFARQVHRLRALGFWPLFHEVRVATYLMRTGCRIAYPVVDRVGKGERSRKNPDLSAWTPSGTLYAFECKRTEYNRAGTWSRDRERVLRQIQGGIPQLEVTSLPGVLMVQTVPNRKPDGSEIEQLLESARGLLAPHPTVVGLGLFVDYIEQIGPQERHILKHMSGFSYTSNRSSSRATAKEIYDILTAVPPPPSMDLFEI